LLVAALLQGEKKQGGENNPSISGFFLFHQECSIHNLGLAGPMQRKPLFSHFALQNIFIL
jgi:hypothetical protein